MDLTAIFCSNRSNRLAEWRYGLALILFAIFSLQSDSTVAQLGLQNRLPNQRYYQTFPQYYTGDFQRSSREFERGFNTAYREGQRRYLDSVCFLTMMGECQYHMGNYSEALGHYESALRLYLSYNKTNWQARIQVPATLTVDNGAFQRSNVNWGTPTRRTAVPNIPSSFQVLFGRFDAGVVIVAGGVFDPAQLRSVDVTEIMRCTALAMHRRRKILGAINRLDPLSKELLTGLTLPDAGNGSIMGAYNGVLLGMALASMERFDDAARMLTSSLQIDQTYDHPLTPVALIELAQMNMDAGKNVEAAGLALEASYSAGVFNQYDMVEESLSIGTTNHLLNFKTPYAPLPAAIAWANRDRVRLLQLSLIQHLAECHAESGNTAAAREVVAASSSATNRRRNTLFGSVPAARLSYTLAVCSFMEGNFSQGMSDLKSALEQYQNGSFWLFRLGLATRLAASGSVSELDADRLFETLLHDPNEAEWKLDPIEPMSFLASNHVPAMEMWFDILIKRRRFDKALEVSEMIRRHRFYSALPLGGRLLAFRYGLNTESKLLDPETIRQRDSFLQRHGDYITLLNRANLLQQELVKLPLKPEEDSDDANAQLRLLQQLGEVSNVQEAMLASFALSREPSNLSFPPQYPLEQFKRVLPKGTLCLSTLETANGYHLFFVSHDRVRYVNLGSSRRLEAAVQALLKQIGAIGLTADPEVLRSDQWKTVATNIKEAIFAGIPDESFANIVELVVIPDGMLWYLPLEALPLEIDGEEKFLVDLCPVRYAPTMFLAGEAPGGGQMKRTMVAAAKMHARGDVAKTIEAVDQLKQDLTGVEVFETGMRLPTGLHAWLTDHLLVWSENYLPPSVFDLKPVPFDATNRSSINAWMSLPVHGPEFVSLPGLQTFGKGRKANGSEMFLTSVSLMASGTRTLLLPRWPGGGATSLGLTRMYAKNLESQTGPESLRSAMIEARKLDFDAESEPQVKTEKEPQDISLEHPFFWAGFLVVDTPRLKPAAVVPQAGAMGGAMAAPLPGGGMPPVVPGAGVDPPVDPKVDPPVDPDADPAGDVLPGGKKTDPPKVK